MLIDAIPVGRDNAVTREELCQLWGMSDRNVRRTIAILRLEDNGDGYVIISHSGAGRGYYRSNDPEDIRWYWNEQNRRCCEIRATLKKAERILKGVNGYGVHRKEDRV